nr:DUF3006 domain-containing protein [uncultured Anaerotignum sp.]
MAVILDRFEGDIAVLLEGTQTREVPKSTLSKEIKEGDVVFLDINGVWKKNAEETKERKAKIAKKMDALWE